MRPAPLVKLMLESRSEGTLAIVRACRCNVPAVKTLPVDVVGREIRHRAVASDGRLKSHSLRASTLLSVGLVPPWATGVLATVAGHGTMAYFTTQTTSTATSLRGHIAPASHGQ